MLRNELPPVPKPHYLDDLAFPVAYTPEELREYGRAVEQAAYAAAIKAIDAKTLPGKSTWAEGYRDGLNAGATAVMQFMQEQPK